jgi:uncharacterized protein (DUF697 family)
MHDIDRTLADTEYEPEMEAYEADYEGEWEGAYDEEEEYGYESEYDEGEGVFDEAEEMELAAELLSVSDDAELEFFLGSLIKKVGRKVRRAVKSKTGRALGRILKGAARKALPIVGGAVGTAFGGPAGAAIGSRLASAGGRLFGLELEGLSSEDQEFEVARRVVRLAGDAAKNAAVQPATGSAVTDAKVAVVKAAKKHAPGLLGPSRAPMPMAGGLSGRSGRWIRRGRKIVLMGV